jgi:hypothetical protein
MSRWSISPGLVVGLLLGVAPHAQAASLKGRVVDTAGKAVDGAEVRVWQKVVAANGARTNELVRPGGAETVQTDEQGRFQTADGLTANAQARMVVEAPDFIAGRTAWLIPGSGTTEVGMIALRRPRTLAGRVVDAAGQAVAGALVFSSGDAANRAVATSDVVGRFQLAAVPPGRVFVFADEPGFRFAGVATADEPAVELTLVKAGHASSDAPVGPALPEEPATISMAERLELARRLFVPYLAAVGKRGEDGDKYWALCEWSLVDPHDAFDRLGEWSFKDNQQREDARGNVIINWMRRASAADWDEIQAVIESSDDPGWMASSFIRGAVFMPTADIDRRRQWLDEAALHAGQITEPSSRAGMLAWLALRWRKLGDVQRAVAARHEAGQIAEQLPGTDFDTTLLFGSLAEAFADDNPELTLKWLDRMDHAGRYGYQAGVVAARWATERPAEAERLWRGAAERGAAALIARDLRLPQLCFRMATVDRQRALVLAGAAHDITYQTNARGAIAEALATADPAAACAIIELAMTDPALHDDCPPSENAAPEECPAVAVARLLPMVAGLNRDLAREVCWRAIALRCPIPPRAQPDDEHDLTDVALAQLLARYDRSLARSLLEPIAERLADFAGQAEHRSQKAMQVVSAAALIDPTWAVDLWQRLPETASADFRLARNEALSRLVRVLALTDNELWPYAGFWKPD